MGLIGYLVYFNTIKSDDFINSPYNTRQDTFADRVVRGNIVSSDGEILAQTNVSEDGTEERSYPYSNIFAHVVGYDSNGKSGIESEANFQLLSSHEFFLNQIRNEFMGTKNTGDTVVSTLSADLQTTAYNALGDRRGAVVALEPSTGKILAMVSKPDFDPNTISLTLHVVCKYMFRNSHTFESMDHTNKEVFLFCVRKEFYISFAAMMADHCKASHFIRSFITRIHVYESPVHLIAFASLTGVTASAVSLRRNCLSFWRDEIPMIFDISFYGSQAARVPLFLDSFKNNF